jgi:hypothetical protein
MTTWIPFLHAMLVVLASFLLISLSILSDFNNYRAEKAKTKLLDKLHFAMSQSPKRDVAWW